MRPTSVLALAFLLGAPALAPSHADADGAREKSIMNRGGERPALVRDSTGGGTTIDSVLDSNSPTWDRIFSPDVAPNCGADSTPSGKGQGVPYAAFQIFVSQQEDLEAVIDLGGTTVRDTVMAVYCDPFDPATPMARLVAYDDDSGPGQLEAAFIAADGVTLSPGPPGGPPRIYYLVVSSFSPGDFGTFRVNLTSATVQVVPVELQSFTVK